jgi:hypothetical protein
MRELDRGPGRDLPKHTLLAVLAGLVAGTLVILGARSLPAALIGPLQLLLNGWWVAVLLIVGGAIAAWRGWEVGRRVLYVGAGWLAGIVGFWLTVVATCAFCLA